VIQLKLLLMWTAIVVPGDREKSEEDGDNDDMLGGVFAFSEEGRTLKQFLYIGSST
jgi:hypothetical protein